MTTENKIKYFENREDWRKWLMDNFDTANEIWFVFPGKSSGEKSILYNDAVDEVMYQMAIKQVLDNLDGVYFDSEDQDQFCASIEALMDIVGLESSGGLLNKWRYGFIPDDDK